MSASLDHLRQGGLDGAADAEQVHVDDALEGLRRHRPEGRHARGDAGVGDHHVEAAEALDGLRHGALYRAAVGDVGGHADRAGVVQLGGRAGGGLLVEVGYRHRGAPGDQRAGGGKADPASAAGDEGDLAP